MTNRSRSNAKSKETEARCTVCGHLESEHATTGTRPCLATVGELLVRDFCSCDVFRLKVAKAA
jgi:hypothetical protein